MKPILHVLLLFALTFGSYDAIGQVEVYFDDFNGDTDPAWTTSGSINGTAWEVTIPNDDWGARRNDSPAQLELTNDVGANGNNNGYCLVTLPTTDFQEPYTTILSNGGITTWYFNMRQFQSDPGGFNAGSYGVAFILAGETASNSAGSGYAVVLGQSGTLDSVRLVKYTGGFNANSDLTNIIKSNTTGLSDIGNQYLSIKVTYNPCLGGEWELFLRNDGTSAFADPTSGTLTSQGTATDNTHTGLALNVMAAYWNGSTAAGRTAFFDNVSVYATELPAMVPGANPSVCSGVTTANLTYTGLAGGANQYTIDWNGAAEAQGFADLPLTSLPASPIVLTVPGGAAPATYNGDLILINSTTTCESVLYPISVEIKPLPVVACPNDTSMCSNAPAYMLTGGTPSGGTYSGPGVSAGMFNPATANTGLNVITYSYTGVNMCTNTCTFDINVNAAPVAIAGTYAPACFDDPDINLIGMPSGGTWTGQGVSGNTFDPSFGTETLTYTYTAMNGCVDADQTTIVVNSCLDPSTMRWTLLEQNQQSGSCTSNSNCDLNRICYGLEYTPLYTGTLTSYTTGFFMDCNAGTNPVISNVSCVMNNNSQTLNFCATADSVLFNSSGNSGGLAITVGVPVILHQVCFTIPSSGVMIITKDNTLGLSASIDSVGSGGFETDNIQFYTPYAVDSAVDCAILPLTWLAFTAKAHGELISKLDWTTANELNNSHFEIQRSFGEGYSFQTIGRVEADEEVRNVHPYTFIDEHARPGKNYYRLKQVDYDGRFQYSPLRTVTFTSTKFAVDIWPNPAQENVTVYIRQAEFAGQIALVDLAGRVVYTKRFDAGAEAHEIATDHFDSGVYTLVVTSGDNRHVQKLVIIE